MAQLAAALGLVGTVLGSISLVRSAGERRNKPESAKNRRPSGRRRQDGDAGLVPMHVIGTCVLLSAVVVSGFRALDGRRENDDNDRKDNRVEKDKRGKEKQQEDEIALKGQLEEDGVDEDEESMERPCRDGGEGSGAVDSNEERERFWGEISFSANLPPIKTGDELSQFNTAPNSPMSRGMGSPLPLSEDFEFDFEDAVADLLSDTGDEEGPVYTVQFDAQFDEAEGEGETGGETETGAEMEMNQGTDAEGAFPGIGTDSVTRNRELRALEVDEPAMSESRAETVSETASASSVDTAQSSGRGTKGKRARKSARFDQEVDYGNKLRDLITRHKSELEEMELVVEKRAVIERPAVLEDISRGNSRESSLGSNRELSLGDWQGTGDNNEERLGDRRKAEVLQSGSGGSVLGSTILEEDEVQSRDKRVDGSRGEKTWEGESRNKGADVRGLGKGQGEKSKGGSEGSSSMALSLVAGTSNGNANGYNGPVRDVTSLLRRAREASERVSLRHERLLGALALEAPVRTASC